ncbi:helix-turn-helix domain-containing protein [Luteibacter sp. 621]|uniref:helix-turn-helix domain-containing protein n=1 Tax=Luteibacter sp. 621 TaxID=3373916 RepID=UPI003D1914C4
MSDDRFADLRRFVEASIDVSLPTSRLAEVAGLSVSYFHRAFVLRMGKTPHAWVMELRLRRARDMILSSSSSLTAIAADCGFFDQAHLTNTFRRIHGQSPNRWREEQAARRRA